MRANNVPCFAGGRRTAKRGERPNPSPRTRPPRLEQQGKIRVRWDDQEPFVTIDEITPGGGFSYGPQINRAVLRQRAEEAQRNLKRYEEMPSAAAVLGTIGVVALVTWFGAVLLAMLIR